MSNKRVRCYGCTWTGSSDRLEPIDTGEGQIIRLCPSCMYRRKRRNHERAQTPARAAWFESKRQEAGRQG